MKSGRRQISVGGWRLAAGFSSDVLFFISGEARWDSLDSEFEKRTGTCTPSLLPKIARHSTEYFVLVDASRMVCPACFLPEDAWRTADTRGRVSEPAAAKHHDRRPELHFWP